MFASYGQP